MFRTLRDMGAFMGLIHRTLFAPLYLALQYWNRKSELSADRCGMIITSEEVYQSSLVKLASGLKETPGMSRCLIEQNNTKHLSIPRYGAESNKSIAVYSTRIRSCVPVLWK